MTNDFVNRRAHRLWESSVAEIRRVCVAFDCSIVNDLVELISRDAWPDCCCSCVQNLSRNLDKCEAIKVHQKGCRTHPTCRTRVLLLLFVENVNLIWPSVRSGFCLRYTTYTCSQPLLRWNKPSQDTIGNIIRPGNMFWNGSFWGQRIARTNCTGKAVVGEWIIRVICELF